jgi:hypothetical protein
LRLLMLRAYGVRCCVAISILISALTVVQLPSSTVDR